MIPLSIPNISGNEWNYIKECLDTNFVSSAGQFVTKFENEFAKKLNAKHAIAVMNGTAAIHLSLIITGITSQHEVLVPNLTFVAPLNAVKYIGAKPVLFDSNWDNLGVDIDKLEVFLKENTKVTNDACINSRTGQQIKAIIPMHTLGHACDMSRLVELCKRFKLIIIEDASESLGAKWNDRLTGTWGEIGCFSFNGNKIITSGGGGMIVTNDDTLAKKAKHLSTTAKSDNLNFVHNEIGYNYRMVNILAALGLAQFEKLDSFLATKYKNAKIYQNLIPENDSFEFYMPKFETASNHWFYSIRLKNKSLAKKDHFIKELLSRGIDVRPIWTLMRDLPMFSHCESTDLTNSINIHKSIINVPCSTSLEESQIVKVSNTLQEVIDDE